jgi:hypothetical protein
MAIHPQVRVFVRPYGSSVPLGVLAFGIGMFMYAALDAPWVKAADTKTIGVMLVTFVAPLQLVATIIAFLARDTTAGVSLGLFAGAWATTGVLTLLSEPGKLDAAVGYFLIAFTIAALVLACVAWMGQPMFALLLTLSSTRALLSAIYELGGGRGWNQVGGWLACGIFCVAMYMGLAFLLEDAKGHAVLPIGRRGSSREAIEGDLAAQLKGIAGEAGVRKHL